MENKKTDFNENFAYVFQTEQGSIYFISSGFIKSIITKNELEQEFFMPTWEW